MSTIDTNRLRELAEAATPGPWAAGETTDWDGTPQASVNSSATPITWDDHGGEVFKPEDAAYIALIDPPTLIALLDRLEAADQRAAEYASVVEKVRNLDPMWPRGMYGCQQDMFGARQLRDALARGETNEREKP